MAGCNWRTAIHSSPVVHLSHTCCRAALRQWKEYAVCWMQDAAANQLTPPKNMSRSKTENLVNPRDPSALLPAVRAQMEAHPEAPVQEDLQAREQLPPVTPLRRFDT